MKLFDKMITSLMLVLLVQPIIAQSNEENEDRFAFVELLKNEKLISEEVYENVRKRPHLFANYDRHFSFLKSLEKVFIENYPDYSTFYPGVREKAGLYWIKYKGTPPKTKTFDPVPPKPEILYKYKATINKLQEVFLDKGIISQKVHDRLAQLIQYSLILHPKYYIHAVASGNLFEDLNSSASMGKVVMAYKDVYSRRRYLETLEKAKNGQLNYVRLIKSISLFQDFKDFTPTTAEGVVSAARNQLFNINTKIKVDTFIIKKDTLDYEEELTVEDHLFLKIRYEGQRFLIEYPLDDLADNPYHNFKDFVQSEDFVYLLNTVSCDESRWGRIMVVNTRGVIDKLLELYHFEPFNEKFYTLHEGENAFGFLYLTVEQNTALYESGFDARTIKDISINSLFNFSMDGLDPYISFSRKLEMFHQLDSTGFFSRLTPVEHGQAKSKFMLTPLSDPVGFLFKQGMVYEPLFDCVGVVEAASGKYGNPHHGIFLNLQELSGGAFDPSDFSSVRDSQQVTDIMFKLGNTSFEYPLTNFYKSNSMCRDVVNIAADAFHKVNVSDKNFYYPVGYGLGHSPKFVFFISPAEAEVFKKTFNLKMKPYSIINK